MTENSINPIEFTREAAIRQFLDAHAEGMHKALCTVAAVRTVFAAAELAAMAEQMVYEIEMAEIEVEDPKSDRESVHRFHYETQLKSYREAVDMAFALICRLFYMDGLALSELGKMIKWAKQWDRAVSRLELERQVNPEAVSYQRVRVSADIRFDARARIVALVCQYLTENKEDA